jgi:hypothetical protein
VLLVSLIDLRLHVRLLVVGNAVVVHVAERVRRVGVEFFGHVGSPGLRDHCGRRATFRQCAESEIRRVQSNSPTCTGCLDRIRSMTGILTFQRGGRNTASTASRARPS